MRNGNPIKDSLKGVRSFYNPPTGHLHDDAVLLLRQNPSGFYFLVKIRAFVIETSLGQPNGRAMTSSCNRTSKDRHGDLFSFFFFFSQA